jgi:MFS family permease
LRRIKVTRGESRSTTETSATARDDPYDLQVPAADMSAGSVTGGATAALISVCLGFFVIQLDVTIVNVALPAIQREIGGSLAGLQWVIDAYTLALASIMLTAGFSAWPAASLNATRQSGGAFGVAVLGSLQGSGSGHALTLRVPLAVATAGYVIAVTLAWFTIRN